MTGAELLRAGMLTSVGTDAQRTAAAVRAGIARFRETSFLDRRGRPIFMATAPDEDLAPLAASLREDHAISGREAQMLRLAAPALREALEGARDLARIPIFLALPEARPGRPAPIDAAFLGRLATQSGVRFDVDKSRAVAGGRAAGIAVVAEALDRLDARSPFVVVGGVDSHQDAELLASLDAEDRVRAEGVIDGLTPGEGAAFLLLARPGSEREAVATIGAAAMGEEPGHRYSAEPYRGEGLDAALRALFAKLGGKTIQTAYVGLNGETSGAKEWGVAYLRHRDRFAPSLQIQHPADCLGDTGAASGPMMLGLAAIGMEQGHRRSPCLVWCASDAGARGAALLSGGRA